ncbi:MAG: M23 family metallopeptidase [Treponema sp.]|nr:M23 family metallopeptidase [Treponema sp.]
MMYKHKITIIASILNFFFLTYSNAYTAPSFRHPHIAALNNSDPAFIQYQQDVEENRMLLARYRQGLLGSESDGIKKLAQGLTVYRYLVKNGEDLFTIASRCTIPYETIATLNRLEHPSLLQPGKELLLPSLPALFVPLKAETELEKLISNAYKDKNAFLLRIYPEEKPLDLYCLPDQGFSGTERAFFLNAAFRYPLPEVRITSSFGLRKNPVTGTVKVHEGLDLAAPVGTPVYPCRDGVVSKVGYDEVYGNYIIITHEGGWTSVYGHLGSIQTSLQSYVRSSTVIGTVGMTGQTTGPHLHFELRQEGKARDPAPLLPGKGKN